ARDVRQHDRVVPVPANNEGQFEGLRVLGGCRRQAGDTLEIELTSRNRGRSVEPQSDLAGFHLHVFYGRTAVGDLHADGKVLERSSPAAEASRSRKRSPLEAAQELLHVQPGERSLVGYE